MINLLKPEYLKDGDKIGIVSPAGKISSEKIVLAGKTLESWGLNVEIAQHAFGKHFQYSGKDSERIDDFQQLLDNEEISAILCSRGGYGFIRIIDKLDFTSFIKKPKWIIGFSDVTIIHSFLNNTINTCSIHGAMAKTLAEEPNGNSSIYLKNMLWGEPIKFEIPFHCLNKTGNTTGKLIGGNLAILTSLIGTPYDFKPEGKILFIEDIGEYLYRIDRMMWSLKLSGKLERLSGIIVGQFTDLKDNESPFGKTAYEIIEEHTHDLNIPICYGFPSGHENENYPLKLNSEALLTVNDNKTSLSF
jgi:muramoyltetrapeptide carboxypeptidase